jgi:hypothetical protein
MINSISSIPPVKIKPPLQADRTSKVYVIINQLGICGVYGIRHKAEKRVLYLQSKYETEHWIETWEITTDD